MALPPIPSLTFQAGGGGPSGASAGNGAYTAYSAPFDASGFSVNYGNSIVIPTWVWLLAAVAGVMWIRKH